MSTLALGLADCQWTGHGHQWFSGNIISVLIAVTRVTDSHTAVTLVPLVIQWYEVWSVASGIFEDFSYCTSSCITNLRDYRIIGNFRRVQILFCAISG